MENTKQQAISLRKQGKTYPEIQNKIGKKIPKSTLSFWCKHIKLPEFYAAKMKKLSFKNLEYARIVADKVHKAKREKYLENIRQNNIYLQDKLKNKDTSKLLLSALYLAEGGKKTRGSLMFGNSDYLIIKLFLRLLRASYKIDESKFRCTVQCRADQNIKNLENFWSNVTDISEKQFYKASMDKRTLGKRTQKINYRGVCRIDYFSAAIFHELTIIGQIITK